MIGNNITKKSRVEPIKQLTRTLQIRAENGILGAKLPLGELTVEKSTLAPIYVQCCMHSLFNSFVVKAVYLSMAKSLTLLAS